MTQLELRVTSRALLIFLSIVLSPASQAHYTTAMEKGIFELSEFCQYKDSYTELFGNLKLKGATDDLLLNSSNDLGNIQKEIIRSLFEANPTTKEQLATHRHEMRRQCVISGASKMNSMYKLPTSSFTQEEVELVQNMITYCTMRNVFGKTVFEWQKQGLTKNEALTKASEPNIISPQIINFIYDQSFSNKSSANNFLDRMELDCRDILLKRMVRGETVFPWTRHMSPK